MWWPIALLPFLLACGEEPAGENIADSVTEGSSVKTRFPRSLSPRTRKALLTEAPETRIVVTIEVAASDDGERLRRDLEGLDARVRSFDPTTRLLAAEVPVGRLRDLADHDAVVYVDTRDRLAQPLPDPDG